jgi:glycerol kinase
MAIDQGTTSSRVILVNHEGQVVAQNSKEFKQCYPQPGWVEHDAEEIWQVTWEIIEKTLHKAKITPQDIAGIGITNQRETTVVWDRKSGKPIHNAIVWQCRRTAPMCDKMKADGWEDKVRQRTGLVIDAYFSGTKIAWLLEHVPDARARANRGELAFGTIDTWLLYKLTGGKVHASDFTNASRTMIYDIHNKCWDSELLKYWQIPDSLLPEVKPSSCIFGHTAPELFGGVSIPIGGMAGDQQAALYGQGCWTPGLGKNTYGTGCFLLVNTGHKATLSHQGLLTTLACDGDGKPVYALEGAIFITGAAVQWLRDEMKLIAQASETEQIAAAIPDTGGVYMVPAFVGLGAPYWDSKARGAIVGLTRGSNRAHIVRATLEAIAYQTRDVVEVMNAESGVKLNRLNVDGGAARNNFLMQFQADILGVPVDRPQQIETTAMGAAFLAGLSTSFWKNSSELSHARLCEKVFSPAMSAEKREELYQGWKKAVGHVLIR